MAKPRYREDLSLESPVDLEGNSDTPEILLVRFQRVLK